MDLVFRCPRLPAPGETLLGHGFATHPGGKGANQAVAVGRLGGSVRFVGCVGDDDFGVALRSTLEGAGVDTALLATSPTSPSGTAAIWVDDAGMNSIIVAPGANSDVTPEQVASAIAAHPDAVVLAQLEIPLESVVAASQATRFVLNPAPARELPDALLSRCLLITPNESETYGLTGIRPSDDASCLEAGRALLAKGVENVLITLGSRGSYWVSAAGGRHFPAPTVQAIDTTAAGDAFNGALALFMAEGMALDEAIPLANQVGALSTTRRGAMEAMPTRAELGALV